MSDKTDSLINFIVISRKSLFRQQNWVLRAWTIILCQETWGVIRYESVRCSALPFIWPGSVVSRYPAENSQYPDTHFTMFSFSAQYNIGYILKSDYRGLSWNYDTSARLRVEFYKSFVSQLQVSRKTISSQLTEFLMMSCLPFTLYHT